MEKMDGMSMDLTKENIEKIKELFPNVVTEGKIDFDVLRTVLGDEVNASKEKYQFTWNGKAESIKLAQSPSSATLRPCKEKSKDWDTTENLYIEGDNLEVLKQLQKTYFGKIKMIYIDPPYNTGNDFVYKDDFKDSITNYREQTEQTRKSNPETSGRFHTDWLNMMYPRLILARNLLQKDGVIFISVDEHEYANLKKMCDEIFGENNFFGDLVWESTTQPTNAGSAKFNLQKKTEPILLYGKEKASIEKFVLEEIDGAFSYPHQGKFGKCRFEVIEKSDAGGYSRPSMKFAILGQYPREGKRWQIGEETARELERTGKVEIVDGMVKRAVYPEDEIEKKQYKPFWSLLLAENYGTAQTGKDELNKLMGEPMGFDTVKPSKLIKQLLKYIGDDYIILDFFSGSSTTAHAVMELNAEDKGKRSFIMVQIPEPVSESSELFRAGYTNICEMGEDRIRKVASLINANTSTIDTGFRVFELDSTNINPWDNTKEYDEQNIFDTATVFKIDRSKEDILYEIMLKYGIFDQPVSEVDINGKTMYRVGQRHMIVCLEDNIDDKDVAEIAKLQARVVVFKEDGFKDDNAKINAEYNLKKAGVEDVKCI